MAKKKKGMYLITLHGSERDRMFNVVSISKERAFKKLYDGFTDEQKKIPVTDITIRYLPADLTRHDSLTKYGKTELIAIDGADAVCIYDTYNDRQTPCIYYFVVNSLRRRQGLADALMNEVMKTARKRRFNAISIKVDMPTDWKIKWLNKYGFKQDSENDNTKFTKQFYP